MKFSVTLFLFAGCLTANTLAAGADKRLPTTTTLPKLQGGTGTPIILQPPPAPKVTKIFRELDDDAEDDLIYAQNTDRCVFNATSDELGCIYNASCTEVQRMVKMVTKFASDVAIGIKMERIELVECPALREIADSIVEMTVGSPRYSWGNRNSSVLKTLRLDNLHHLNLGGHGIRITRDSLSHFKRLVYVTIWGSVSLIENNAFESIPSLNTLALDWSASEFAAKGCLDKCDEPCFSNDAEGHNMYYYKHMQKLHCSADYMWLRTWMNQRPYLTAAKEGGEIYSLLGAENWAIGKNETFLSIDCDVLMKTSCNAV